MSNSIVESIMCEKEFVHYRLIFFLILLLLSPKVFSNKANASSITNEYILLSEDQDNDKTPILENDYQNNSEQKNLNSICDDSCYKVCEPSICCIDKQCYFSAAYLYWRAFEEGLEGCGLTEFNEIEEGEKKAVIFNREQKDFNFEWNGGIRLATGLKLCSNCWDISACWTNYSTKAHLDHKEKDSSLNKEFSEINFLSSEPDSHSFEKLNWNLQFNTIDVILGRNFFLCSNSYILKPYLGLRGGNINQKLQSYAVTKFEPIDEIDKIDYITLIKKKQKFDGIGPFLGLNVDWKMGCNFSLYGNIDAGVLYGHYHIKSNKVKSLLNEKNFCNDKENKQGCPVFADAELGIRWNYCFCDCLHFMLQLSYEYHRYFDHNKIGDNGDLFFSGGSFTGSLEF